MRIRMVRETTLAANQWLEDARQMDWSTRYVYNGGDDGILQEDIPYEKDDPGKQTEQKETGYSDEEQDHPRKKYTRQKYAEKNKPKYKTAKINNREYERRKRAVNITENINENVINKTLDEGQTSELLNQTHGITAFNVTTKGHTVLYEENLTTQAYKITSSKQHRLHQINRTIRPHGSWSGIVKENDEIKSDEEDFSANLRKRPKRKRPANQKVRAADLPPEDSDDGVTKSIYEMYYRNIKTNSKLKPSQPELRIRRKKKKNRRYRQNKDYEDQTASFESNTKRGRRGNMKKGSARKADMPFFLEDGKNQKSSSELKAKELLEIETEVQSSDMFRSQKQSTREKRRKPDSQEYDDPDSNEEDNDRYTEYTDVYEKVMRRRKRNAPKEEDSGETNSSEADNPTADTEFVITLRPTQIRTFVIWFHEPKKNL